MSASRDVNRRVEPALRKRVRRDTLGEQCMICRRFATVLVGAALVCAGGQSAAQERKLPKIGEIWGGSNAEESAPYRQPFLKRMRELGWIDGKTAQFIVRYYGPKVGNAAAVAKELVAQKVDVLVVSDFAWRGAREATATTPIVCMDMYDPVVEGATTSLARPSANMTGVSWQSFETAAKRVELAKDFMPDFKRAALIYDATDPGSVIESGGFVEGAKKVGVGLDVFPLRGLPDLDQAIAKIKTSRPDALFVAVNPFTVVHLSKITQLATQARIASVSEIAEFVKAGFLLSYGVNIDETYSRAADLTHRILKGAKPHDLPYEQPTKFDLAVNLKTAKAIGIRVPQSILLRATEVIR
jgi:putative tryptophan/tyrosine transport system substrate-binding protein